MHHAQEETALSLYSSIPRLACSRVLFKWSRKVSVGYILVGPALNTCWPPRLLTCGKTSTIIRKATSVYCLTTVPGSAGFTTLTLRNHDHHLQRWKRNVFALWFLLRLGVWFELMPACCNFQMRDTFMSRTKVNISKFRWGIEVILRKRVYP